MNGINELLKGASATGYSPLYLFFLAFLAGITISFTPCVYPMIPITAGILQAQATQSIIIDYNRLTAGRLNIHIRVGVTPRCP